VLVIPWLSACLFVSEGELAEVIDGDGDGSVGAALGGDDCDDAVPTVHPDAEDPPYDGADTDCDGADDFDADRDGLPAAAFGGTDCDDADAAVGAETVDWHPDCDGDGVGAAISVTACGPPTDALAGCDGGSAPARWLAHRDGANEDCDDGDDSVFPGRVDEPYDGVDADCAGGNDWDADGDGFVHVDHPERADAVAPGVGDCDDGAAGVFPGATEVWYDGRDEACDGGDDFDRDGDGAPLGADCDDSDPAVRPGAADVPYDGIDADCDGASDWDADRDGFAVVGPPPLDCDDARPDVNPLADDPPYDGLDADCDGANDFDADRDGWVDAAHPGRAGGTAPEVGDCDDGRADVHPTAADAPLDGLDADCDGRNDHDADRDGFVALGREVFAGGTAPGVGDCDDADPAVHPGATERWYDGTDQDCDGANDFDRDRDGASAAVDCDDDDDARAPGRPEVFYDGIDGDCAGGDDFDADGDGAPAPIDCDDTDPDRTPGAPEVWYDGVDADCDGADDLDADGDGFRATSAGGDDCADFDPARHPGAADPPYDAVDADCDGANDFDADRDGAVAAGFGAFADGLAVGDCDDADAAVRPGAPEVWYDGVDADCDGADDFDRDGDGAPAPADCDDGDPSLSPTAVDLRYDGIDADCAGDNDFDRDGDGVVASAFPGTEGGTAPAGGDCDDGDPAVRPGAVDLPTRDRDCDGVVVVDADGDGVAAADDCDDADPSRHVGGVRVVGVGEDPVPLVAAACPGARLELPAVAIDLSGPLVASVPVTLAGRALLRAAPGTRALDVVAGPFASEGVRYAGGAAVDGGCARLAADAVFVDGAFEGCVATGSGGAAWVAPGVAASFVGVDFEGNRADRGGDLAATGAALDLAAVVSDGAAAREGGAWWVSAGSLSADVVTLSASAASSSGGAVWADGAALSLSAVAIVGASTGDQGAAATLRSVTGAVDGLDVVAASGPASFDGTRGAVAIEGGTGALRLERVVITGAATASGLALVEPRGAVVVHDLEVGYQDGLFGVFAHAESGSGTLAVDNALVHHLDSPWEGAAGIWWWSAVNAQDWALRNATITQSTAELALFFACHACGAMEVGSVLAGSPSQIGRAAGVLWIDTFGQVDVHHTATLYDRPWMAAWSGPEGYPPACTSCLREPGHPFVVPVPGVDVHLDPASPLATAGDPAPCGAEARCLEPGFWGGPDAPEAR
jgi:hypothetical protein